MHVNTFSRLDVIVALDARNIEAHHTATLEAIIEHTREHPRPGVRGGPRP
ncbi:hypothetical protein ACIBG0_39470 [Nocardia sp. NPDC050630]